MDVLQTEMFLRNGLIITGVVAETQFSRSLETLRGWQGHQAALGILSWRIVRRRDGVTLAAWEKKPVLPDR